MAPEPLDQPVSDRRTRGQWAGLGLAVVAALAVRCAGLGTVDFRSDEMVELFKAEHLRDVLLHGMFLDTHAPFFPILTALWSLLGLTGREWTARLLPALLGTAAVPLLYGVTRRLFEKREGLFAAWLLALSPFFVLLSRDLKDDIFLVFMGLLTAYWLVRATQDNRPSFWAAYALTATIACYAQFFMGPFLVAINLWFLALARTHRDRLRPWLIANSAAFLLVIPVLIFAIHRSQALLVESDRWWVPRPTLITLTFYFKTLAFGYSDLKPHYKVALAVYAILSLAGFVWSWKRNPKSALLLCFWLPLTVGAIFAVSQRTQSIFLYRSLALSGIPFYVWAAVALARIRPWPAQAGIAAVLVFLAGSSLAQLYAGHFSRLEFPHRPGNPLPMTYEKAAEFMRPLCRPGDLVAHTAHTSIYPLYHYGLREQLHATVGVEEAPIDNFRRCHPRIPLPREFELVYMTALQPLAEQHDRIWLVFTESERIFLPWNPMSVYRWLDSHFNETSHKSFGEFEVFLFERNATFVRSRDRDDGVTATMRYEGGLDETYSKVRPDAGLEPAPPEARRGTLTLFFSNDAPRDVISRQDFTGGQQGRRVTFSLTNSSDTAVECTLECVPSDLLLELASLDEEIPASGGWTVTDMFNPSPPPAAYGLPTAAAHVASDKTAVMTGAVSLPPGVYRTQVRLLGYPGETAKGRAELSLQVGGTDLLHVVPPLTNDPLAWQWFPGALLTVPSEAATDAPVRLEARLPEGLGEAWNDAAYVAFRAAGAPDTPGPWPGRVNVPAQTTLSWSCTLNDPRLDIWAYEHAPDGHAYRIFRTWR